MRGTNLSLGAHSRCRNSPIHDGWVLGGFLQSGPARKCDERTPDFGVVRIRGSPLAAFRSLSDHCISKGATRYPVTGGVRNWDGSLGGAANFGAPLDS